MQSLGAVCGTVGVSPGWVQCTQQFGDSPRLFEVSVVGEGAGKCSSLTCLRCRVLQMFVSQGLRRGSVTALAVAAPFLGRLLEGGMPFAGRDAP